MPRLRTLRISVRPLVVGDRPHQRQRDLLVAAGLQVARVALARADRLAALRHVRRLALQAGSLSQARAAARRRLPSRRRTGAAGPAGTRPRVCCAAARPRHRLAGEVVVVQVLVRDRAQRPQPVRAEQPALLERGQRVRRRPAAPAAGPCRRRGGRAASRGGSARRSRTTPVAGRPRGPGATRRPSPDGESQMPITRSPRCGDIASVTMPAGLVKLMTQASGATAAIRRAISVRDRHRPQPVGDAARADGLLAEHALVERDPLVDAPGPSSPPTRIAENTKSAPRSASSRSVVDARPPGRRVTPAACSASTRAIAASRDGVGVVQGDVGDPALAAVGQQRPVDQRDPEAAAAEDASASRLDHLHPRLVERRERRRVGAGVGDHDVEVLRARRPGRCRCPGTCRRRRAARPGRWRRSSPA